MSWKLTKIAKSSWIGEPLSTVQLENALSQHLPKCVFGGVLASNQLADVKPSHYPKAYVVNTDDETKPGRHWTVFVCEEPGQVSFFDSYGCPPEVYGSDFRRFVRHQNVNHQPRWIQGLNSFVCGHYCLFYLCHRFHVPTPHALSMFGSVYQENDRLILLWTRDHFSILPSEKGQTCLCFLT